MKLKTSVVGKEKCFYEFLDIHWSLTNVTIQSSDQYLKTTTVLIDLRSYLDANRSYTNVIINIWSAPFVASWAIQIGAFNLQSTVWRWNVQHDRRPRHPARDLDPVYIGLMSHGCAANVHKNNPDFTTMRW